MLNCFSTIYNVENINKISINIGYIGEFLWLISKYKQELNYNQDKEYLEIIMKK